MALATASLTKSKPNLFLPVRRAKALNPSSVIRNSHQYNPECFILKTKCKRESLNLFSFPNKISRNAAAAKAIGMNDSPLSEADVNKYSRILLSDVVVKRKRNIFLGRKWSSMDIATAGIVLAIHLLSLFAPFHFNWSAFGIAFGLYVVTGLLGITLSYHRNLCHRSFKLPKWLEYLFAYCGVHALQGSPIDWVSTHRYHHLFCDSERDPHSPTEGFWYSHMSWLFDTNSIMERCGGTNNVGDLEKQPFYKFMKNTYILHPIALGILLYALGGLPFLVWGMVRIQKRSEDYMGIPHNLASKFSLSCMGKSVMEYW
ncbi:palmitoyl-monogalactosyldiacylglycerol delta-7 desaturase, chloroplastic-like isoform X3 [Euphorbia lathyris]|uniref:palmitoyl-monogalactosyldiacylglycerol delta-7 desaturase, chloroplastic-like isoform X3 n=1 Tax=Euphorbia lathyris TaxID=212925 RepID=UPI0033138371